MQKENFPETYAPGDEPAALKLSNGLRRVVEFVGRWGSWFIVPLVLVTVTRRRGAQAHVPCRRRKRVRPADLVEDVRQPLLRIDLAAGARMASAHGTVRSRAGLRHDLQYARARRSRPRSRELPQEDLDRVPGPVVLHDPLPAPGDLFRLELGGEFLRAGRNLGLDRGPEPPLDHQEHTGGRADHGDHCRYRRLAAGGAC